MRRRDVALTLSAGSPLSIDDLLQTTLFHHDGAKAVTAVDDGERAHFPIITAIEHPGTGHMVYSLHPCETANALAPIVDEHADPFDILKTCFMLWSTMVDLR